MKLNYHLYVLVALIIIILIVVVSKVFYLFNKRNKRQDIEKKWKEIQKSLAKKTNWRKAINQADILLDETLKLKHFKGKTTGERLVSAQHKLTANDMVWFSHKLHNKLIYDPDLKISKSEVKKCLLGYWKALRDLGVFNKRDE